MKIAAIVLVLGACLLPAAVRAQVIGNGTAASPYDNESWETIAVTASPLSAEKGPADQYFGKFKFSNLEVRNTVHDLRIQGNSPVALPSQRFHIEEARSALAMWNDLYPRDPWIPSTMLQLADEIHEKEQADLDNTALYMYMYLSGHFSGHYFAKIADARMLDFVPAPPYDITAQYVPYFPAWDVVDIVYPEPH